MSKSKKKRRQPSQEPVIVTSAELLAVSHQQSAAAGLGGGALHQMQSHAAHRSNETNLLGSQGTISAGGALGSNPLEQETFSMQHDTFQGQADGADQQEYASSS